MANQFIMAFSLALISVVLTVPLTAALPPPPRPAASDAASMQPIIANGTMVAVPAMSETFLFCWVDGALAHQIEWWDSRNNPVPHWSPQASRYQLGSGAHLPHAYLVFVDFHQPDVYTCVARGAAGMDEGSASVTVTLAMP
ncbi:uncharacterized protein LOC123514620 [Portunus trituberculatus]|uniref:uncharacterized protein LOC123514620 n=1 Tax=Portunus trituberculatus TaxID=210409 RepID=UPI001E1D0589|nr:uncharacterized protein LOC123514620 [Portunus trituberculatus]